MTFNGDNWINKHTGKGMGAAMVPCNDSIKTNRHNGDVKKKKKMYG